MTSLPVALLKVSLSSRASDRLRRKGAASDAGILAGSDGPRLRTVSAATCSSLIDKPSEKYCNGDQLISMLSAVMTLSLLRYTSRSMCIRWYSDPLTPVTDTCPPLALEMRCTSCCRVDSRPSSQKAPASRATSTTSEISTRRGQRRRAGADAGVAVVGASGVGLSLLSAIRR
ncbi:hypothetical protein Jab_1c09090 [Janthinobacterium sp. HH01]|nr:hypothetical protein Jab_1c09090 [Janthinobacterium sp. HH01]